jgi:hypothetical protein
MARQRVDSGSSSSRTAAVGRPRWKMRKAAAPVFAALGAALVLVLAGCGGQTTGASDVSDIDATLNANVNWNNGDGPGELWFEYSSDNGNTWTETPHQTFGTLGCGSNPCSTSVSVDVTDLSPSTGYIYRLGGCLSGSSPCSNGTTYFDRNGTGGGTAYSSFTTQAPQTGSDGESLVNPPSGNQVEFDYARTQETDTIKNGLPVQGSSPTGAAAKNIMTMTLHGAPAGENLRVSYVMRASECIQADILGQSDHGAHTPCTQMNNFNNYQGCCNGGPNPDVYDPSIAARVVLLDNDTGDVVAQSDWKTGTSPPDLPDGTCAREHHCMVRAHYDTVHVPGSIPAGHTYKLRLQAVAYDQKTNSNPNTHDVVQVDADCSNNSYTSCNLHHLNANAWPSVGAQMSLLRPGANRNLPDSSFSRATDGPYTKHSSVSGGSASAVIRSNKDNGSRVVIASVPITSYHAGDLIDVTEAQTDAADHPGDGHSFSHYVTTSLVLATSADAAQGHRVLFYLSPWAGANCNPDTGNSGACGDARSVSRFHTTGMAPIPSGQTGNLHVNLLGRADDDSAGKNDKVDFTHGSIDLLCSSPDAANPGCN